MLEFLKRRFFGPEKANHSGQRIRLTLEEFENRFLPSASPLLAGVNPPGFGGSSAAGADTGTHLSASLSGVTGAAGTASFNAGTVSGQNSLKLQVTGLTANSNYTVQVNGTSVGQIHTDASGNATLSLSNISPSVTAGSAISVLDSTGATALQGTFASTECSSGSGISTTGTSSSSTGTFASSLLSTSARITADALAFAADLRSGNYSGALAALQDFEAYQSTTQSLSLQEQQALAFLDQVFADLA
jgi:hypothetical protein